jgi:ribosomal protein L18
LLATGSWQLVADSWQKKLIIVATVNATLRKQAAGKEDKGKDKAIKMGLGMG